MTDSILTCVSGYWEIKNKHNDNSFEKWFQNTLKINCPYVFFGNKESIKIVKGYRGNLPTHYVELEIEDFETYQYKDKMVVDAYHCPSVDLNLIWNEKIFMIDKASILNPFSSEYFMWVDAGICVYREIAPPSEPFSTEKISSLPHDKMIYTSSEMRDFNESHFLKNPEWKHHVSGTYIVHKNIIKGLIHSYKDALNKYMNKDIPYTDQILWTYIYKDYKHLFYKIDDGYGVILKHLY